MILTDEQVAEISENIYPIIDDTTDGEYIKKDILYKERAAYENGWKDCTEHYKQLIEDGMKWKQLVQEVEYQSSKTNDPMSFHLTVGEITTEMIQKQ